MEDGRDCGDEGNRNLNQSKFDRIINMKEMINQIDIIAKAEDMSPNEAIAMDIDNDDFPITPSFPNNNVSYTPLPYASPSNVCLIILPPPPCVPVSLTHCIASVLYSQAPIFW